MVKDVARLQEEAAQKEKFEKIKARFGDKFNDFLGSWQLGNGELLRSNFDSFVTAAKEELKGK